MNKKKRFQNRTNSEKLKLIVRNIELSKHICENCGEPGGHWVCATGFSLQALLSGEDDQQGFWTCSKYYGPDGRRLPEYTEQNFIF